MSGVHVTHNPNRGEDRKAEFGRESIDFPCSYPSITNIEVNLPPIGYILGQFQSGPISGQDAADHNRIDTPEYCKLGKRRHPLAGIRQRMILRDGWLGHHLHRGGRIRRQIDHLRGELQLQIPGADDVCPDNAIFCKLNVRKRGLNICR
jgi:hypothetical protein